MNRSITFYIYTIYTLSVYIYMYIYTRVYMYAFDGFAAHFSQDGRVCFWCAFFARWELMMLAAHVSRAWMGGAFDSVLFAGWEGCV